MEEPGGGEAERPEGEEAADQEEGEAVGGGGVEDEADQGGAHL